MLIGAEIFWNFVCINQIKTSNEHPTLKNKIRMDFSGSIKWDFNAHSKDTIASCFCQ